MMATLAVGTESNVRMIRICCTGQIAGVTGFAFSGSTGKFVASSGLMASLAVRYGVHAG